jgi:Domain of unknown function (DUF4126)
MHTFLVIAQGAGLAAACGIRPFLPALLAGALAGVDRGLSFDGTDFVFLERPTFLLAVLLALIAVVVSERRRGPSVADSGPLGAAVAGVGIGLGAAMFGGSLADEHHAVWPGLVGGLLCAALASAAMRQILRGAAVRLDEKARGALSVYADGMALVLAAIAIALPPLSLVAIALLAFLLVRGRAREGRKYAGLRSLR